jgi:hypothetical protein
MTYPRYPYRDGIGHLRCNGCLERWAACTCPPQLGFDFDTAPPPPPRPSRRVARAADRDRP